MKKFGLSLLLIATLILSACGQAPTNDGTADAGNSNTPTKQEQKAAEKEAQEFLENISAETATYKGVCGENTTWYWQDNVLVIKGTGAVIDAMWLAPDESWLDLSDSAKIIQGTTLWAVIEDGITNIPKGAFGDFEHLTKVHIPNTVTSIGHSAFSSCGALTSVTIPDSVTSIGDSAFSNCDSLTSVTIPSNVTTIGRNAFYHCTNLKSVISEAELTDNIFDGCDNLTQINVRHSNNTIIDGVVFNKDKSKLIIYPSGKTETTYTIPDSVTTIGDSAFSGCDSLASVTIPDSVTTIGSGAFNGCESLASVTIPDSVTSIGDYAFYRVPHIYYNGTAEGSPWRAEALN